MKKEVKEKVFDTINPANVMAQSIISSPSFTIGLTVMPKVRANVTASANRVHIQTQQIDGTQDMSFEILPTKDFITEFIQLLFKNRELSKGIKAKMVELDADYKEGHAAISKSTSASLTALTTKIEAIHNEINIDVL